MASIFAANAVTGNFASVRTRAARASLKLWARAARVTDGLTVAAVAA